jgi:DNA-binding response OmpR family regulator
VFRDHLILIVEDETYVGLGLALAIEDAEGRVVGPVGTVAEALTLLEAHQISAAVLDANLADRDVTPVAVTLAGHRVPFVVYTGTGLPSELAAVLPDIPVIMKPASPSHVLERLLERIARPEPCREVGVIKPTA